MKSIGRRWIKEQAGKFIVLLTVLKSLIPNTGIGLFLCLIVRKKDTAVESILTSRVSDPRYEDRSLCFDEAIRFLCINTFSKRELQIHRKSNHLHGHSSSGHLEKDSE